MYTTIFCRTFLRPHNVSHPRKLPRPKGAYGVLAKRQPARGARYREVQHVTQRERVWRGGMVHTPSSETICFILFLLFKVCGFFRDAVTRILATHGCVSYAVLQHELRKEVYSTTKNKNLQLQLQFRRNVSATYPAYGMLFAV